MKNNKNLETKIGIIILLCASFLFTYIYLKKPALVDQNGGYIITALFERVDGLEKGADVRIAGIHVGEVFGQTLVEEYRAQVTLYIQKDIIFPEDSSAVIHTDGLFGSKYIEITPGASFDNLEEHGELVYTQESMLIEELLEKIVNMANNKRIQQEEKGL